MTGVTMTSKLSTRARRRPRGLPPRRRIGLRALAVTLALVHVACGGSEQERAAPPPPEQPAADGRPPENQPPSRPDAGKITGRATDAETGRALPNVYVVVGYQGIQRAAITGRDGRYVVPEVPANKPAAILGFHENNYRYHNSQYDRGVVPRLRPGQTLNYDFQVRRLPPGGQPQVTDAVIGTAAARPGDKVQFGLTVTEPGKGGLSEEVFASSPKLGRVAWLRPAGGNRFRGTLTIPRDTPPGEYPFAFFAASNECYDPETFPRRTLRVLPNRRTGGA